MLIVVGTERASDGDNAESTLLPEFALEVRRVDVRRVEVRVRNSVDLMTIVVLLDDEIGVEVNVGGEPVGITAITLVLDMPPLVNNDDTTGADEYGEYPPW